MKRTQANISRMYAKRFIRGFTTNPKLMRMGQANENECTAYTGRCAPLITAQTVWLLGPDGYIESFWDRPRVRMNNFRSGRVGCRISTSTTDVLNKLCLVGKNPAEYEPETPKMCRVDASAAGFEL